MSLSYIDGKISGNTALIEAGWTLDLVATDQNEVLFSTLPGAWSHLDLKNLMFGTMAAPTGAPGTYEISFGLAMRRADGSSFTQWLCKQDLFYDASFFAWGDQNNLYVAAPAWLTELNKMLSGKTYSNVYGLAYRTTMFAPADGANYWSLWLGFTCDVIRKQK